MERSFIRINPADNVVVALKSLDESTLLNINGETIRVTETVPPGHKVAIKDFAPNDVIIKYGFPIGHTTDNITKGAWVNEHNIRTNLNGINNYAYEPKLSQPNIPDQHLTFEGFRRKNGDVGVRNEIWIIPTVGCVNGIAQRLADKLRTQTKNRGVGSITAFTHNYGCSQLGDDLKNTQTILRNMALHPNAGGVLILGLGCENNQPEALQQLLGDYDTERIRLLVCQKVKDEEAEGMKLLQEIYHIASQDKRTPIPLSELRIGLKCGGSDGFSGITANPLLGVLSDFLTAQGGTTVLTEVPEMFGAETILMNRCASETLFDKTVLLINNFKQYFISNNQPVYENPSPGNKAGGISTLEEKSLGCTQKAGSSTVKDVLAYGEQLRTKGLNLLSAPGNDLVASTALAASGCQMILFTTGRGTPFGTFVPTVKISTNSALYKQKPNWIDFNAGTLLEDTSIESLSKQFIKFIIRTASGQQTNNEKNDYREMAIFKSGVTL
ncbi:MAG: altronate dehydratase family protein [Parabacteroides sp.]